MSKHQKINVNAIQIPSTEIPPSMEIFYIPNLSGLNFNQTKDR